MKVILLLTCTENNRYDKEQRSPTLRIHVLANTSLAFAMLSSISFLGKMYGILLPPLRLGQLITDNIWCPGTAHESLFEG